ncbi:MAG: hypothetical protein MOGMAGMI_01785 [Candidatus Omnitrophica bacterium]|nr:hypothetical protein [Candidatus Omnitrophota bacterium]
MSNFRVEIQNSSGSLVWEIPFQSFDFQEELNRDRSATVRFNYEDVKAVADNTATTVRNMITGQYRELYIYDGDTTIYSGYIAEPTISKSKNGALTITVTSKGFFGLLAKRFTDDSEIYSSQDLSDIAWDLIDDSQSLTYGNFGITRGADPTTRNADRTYVYDNIAEAIQKLSNLEVDNGIDFDINNQKQFNVYYPEKGEQRNNIVLEEGFNIHQFTIREIFIDSMVNQVHVLGANVGADQLVETRDADSALKASFFLLQAKQAETSAITAATLQEKGDRIISQRQQPRLVISNIEVHYNDPAFDEYEVGDRLRLVIPTYSVDDYYRLIGRRLDDRGVVSLTFFTM